MRNSPLSRFAFALMVLVPDGVVESVSLWVEPMTQRETNQRMDLLLLCRNPSTGEHRRC